jgi:hypothetical protein
MAEQAARLVKIETRDGVVIALDETGREWVTPIGQRDWRLRDVPEPEPVSGGRADPPRSGRRLFQRRP